MAPTNVFQGELYFIGRQTHKQENQIAFDITQVQGANYVYANREATDSPVPMKQPLFEEMDPFGIGRL